ncbi:MAG: DUF4097 family beta strand repeat-containing protein [Bryobacteraceae bacterium]|jgi:DUF4097 and DUF4098 domain-containing protein YvlB
MLLASALLALASAISLPATGSFHQESSRIYPLSARGQVSLQNINGDVHIRAWDRNEVRIEAVKRAASQGLLKEARVTVDSSADAISIRTQFGDGSNTNPGSVEFTVMVPRQAHLSQIKAINGAVDIEGVSGGINASSVNGPVRAEKIAGDVRLSTVNGKLEATFERLSEAKMISMNSVNGPISLSIPYDAGAEFNARNVTGGIDNDFGMPVRQGHSAGSQMHGVLKGGGTYIDLHNVNGTICIMPMSHGRRVKFT